MKKRYPSRHILIRNLSANESGAVAILFAIGLFALFGVAGIALDYSRATWTQSKMQQALDSAVLAGLSDIGSAELLSGVVGGPTKEQQIGIATHSFSANLKNLPKLSAFSFAFENETLVGQASVRIHTTLLGVLGFHATDVATISKGINGSVHEPVCFMAMHPTRKHTLELSGSVAVVAPDCHVYGNSDNSDDVVDPHSANNLLVGKSVQAVGFGHHYLQNVTPPLEHAPELIADPLAALVIPPAGPCSFNNTVISGGTKNLTPGAYCGGLNISNGAVVSFSPGIYVISGGAFVVSDSHISGDNVMVALADSSATLFWTSSEIKLAAPASGPYAGMAVIGARLPANHIINASTVDICGVVYLLNGAFSWVNSGTPIITANWSAWIIDGVSWDGDGTLHYNFDINTGTVPYPTALMNIVPRPGIGPRLVF